MADEKEVTPIVALNEDELAKETEIMVQSYRQALEFSDAWLKGLRATGA